ncbi:transketolase [Lysinibacillus contaminans]|uniref:Transketolase n=1 Tax=Lysinibacillus contaminans TaxID=1293441 RepID=A0ABR5K0P1_9BACI|nr:transketolase [Lysinibacillus contaminans]KOS68348.1 transketolase [Lysinibacillus contaminans]
MNITDLKIKAAQIRIDLMTMITAAQAGHTGGSLSNTDILTALYYRVMKHNPTNSKDENRDRFIASKGHSVESLWCILADLGYFPKEELTTFSQFGTRLIGHPNNKVSGIEMNTGALGHGLAISVGMALAGKRGGKTYKVYCLMGDGEQTEGSIWEAAMAGAHYKLGNLIGIIDLNGLQISGKTSDVLSSEPLDEKWRAFGWHVIEIDGNDIEQLISTFDMIDHKSDKPTLILAKTTKGKGVSFAENQISWHHIVPTVEQLNLATIELRQQIEALRKEEN